jgi:kynurenine formamidase
MCSATTSLRRRRAPASGTRRPKIVYQIENLTNLDLIPSRVKVVALPAKWKTESAPARVIALLDE